MAQTSRKPDFDIGSRLKAVRAARGVSQRKLARMAGVTNGLISQIEQNSSSPSVSSLKRILDAIPMDLSDFFAAEADPAKIFFTHDELRDLSPAGILTPEGNTQGLIALREVGSGKTRRIQMMHETYTPGADTGPEFYSHLGEESGIVISGQIEIFVGDAVQTLSPGDAYLFDSSIPHRFRNTGIVDCILVSACTPPSF